MIKRHTLLFLLLTQLSFAQTNFQRLIGGTSHERGQGLFETFDHYYVVNGATLSYGQGSADCMLNKTDASGNIVWSKVYGTTAFDNSEFAFETPDHGYMCMGRTSFNTGGSYALIFKTDSAGNFQWGRTFGGATHDGFVYGINTFDGGFTFVGTTQSLGSGTDDIVMIHTDANGDTLFTRAFGSIESESGICVTQTADHGYVIAGRQLALVSGVTESSGVLLKTDESGTLLWANYFKSQKWEELESVVELPSHELVIAGSSVDTLTDFNILFLKTDSAGNGIDVHTYGGIKIDASYNILLNEDSSMVFSGYSESFGYGHSFMGTDSTNIFLMKTDLSGNVIWFRTYGDGLQDEAYRSAKASDGGYMISGFTTDYTPPDSSQIVFLKTDTAGFTGCHEQTVAVTADTLALTQTVASNLIEYSGWLALNITLPEAIATPSNNDACLFLGVNQVPIKNLNVYPNPFGSQIRIVMTEGTIAKQYRLTDISGRLIYDWKKLTAGQMEISIPDIEAGMYLLQVQTESGCETVRIIKQ